MTFSSTATGADKSFLRSSLLLGIVLIAANLRAPITALGPVLTELQQHFAMTPAVAGLLNALPLLIFACGSPMAPWLTRRLGLERALFGALCLIAVGCLIRSSGLYSGLWLGTVLIGAGIAVANVLVVPLVKRDFPDHTALCVGLYAATMALVAALASGLAAPLSNLTSYAWRLPLGIWFVLAILAAVCWWPQLKGVHAPTPAKSGTQASHAPAPVWRSAIAWQVSMFMALQTLVFYTLIDWFPSMVSGVGISAAQAGTYLFAYQAIAVVANLVTSVAIKRLHDQRLLGFICSLCICCGVAGLLWAPTWALLWLLFAGVGAGMSMVTCLTLFGLRTRDHHQASSLSGMAQCVGYGLGATGPFLAGWLHDLSGGWHAPLLVLLASACAQIVFAVLAGRNRYVEQSRPG
ncbi:MFS transporter [Halotalea alkalilenta]|uniref:MFS transporter n=1 Tax=Halotalea alkalilenta TaxID=376489 RepID=A0A172YH02_9GAMM|nr:MFS transporter [Halotalea alkalilenta]ANF58524.1 MFS transporter [Halotalea alkalilenta]